MCGINGIYSFTNKHISSDTVKKMNTQIAFRGPDADGIFSDNKICLGHRRLSIIDLSSYANQPLSDSSNRYTIVFNGEIYNFKELKSKLNYTFKTNSDTEVIIAAYEKWGVNCLNYFNGMFAFAIWDSKEQSLFIARDRIGIKPLYYHQNEEEFIFSSSIKAIAKSEKFKPEVNIEQLHNYINFHTVYSPETILKGIKVLEPGSYALLKNNNVEYKKYWSIREKAVINNNISYKESLKEINSLLSKSVEDRLVSDVDFGAFLSGGIDSSLMVALMSKQSSSKIKTFNVAFGEEDYNESSYAEKISKKYNTEHHKINLDANDLLSEIEPALNFLDFPSSDGINTFIVSKRTAKEGIKMAISGLGGDELFAGYPQFKQIAALEKYSFLDKIPFSIRKKLSSLLVDKKDSRTTKIIKWLETEKWNFKNLYPSFRQQSYYGANLLKGSFEDKLTYFDKSTALNNLSVNEIEKYLENILLRDSDQMSMANALELRVPFMDHKLVEFVLSIKDEFKYPHTQKKLLTDAFPEVFTEEMLKRKKMGFVLPWDIWLKNELKPLVVNKLESLKNYDFFNSNTIDSLWKDFLSGDKRVSWTQVWSLVVLANWLEDIFER